MTFASDTTVATNAVYLDALAALEAAFARGADALEIDRLEADLAAAEAAHREATAA